MQALLDLWLPILVSAVAVFVASFVAWTILPHHKPDVQTLADEAGFLQYLKAQGVKAGFYMFPGCGSKMDDAAKARYEAGPWGWLTVQAAQPSFARNLVLVFLFYVVVSVFVAYVARLAFAADPGFVPVFRVAGTVAVAAYCLGGIPHGLFFGRTPRAMAMDILDGLAYGLITGAVFAWLWPAGVGALPTG
jgi:hypothetical protein